MVLHNWCEYGPIVLYSDAFSHGSWQYTKLVSKETNKHGTGQKNNIERHSLSWPKTSFLQPAICIYLAGCHHVSWLFQWGSARWATLKENPRQEQCCGPDWPSYCLMLVAMLSPAVWFRCMCGVWPSGFAYQPHQEGQRQKWTYCTLQASAPFKFEYLVNTSLELCWYVKYSTRKYLHPCTLYWYFFSPFPLPV